MTVSVFQIFLTVLIVCLFFYELVIAFVLTFAAYREFKKNKKYLSPPSVSVIIPAYNASEYVLACVSSIIEQEGVEIRQIVIVNDGSTDNTSRVLLDHYDLQKLQNHSFSDVVYHDSKHCLFLIETKHEGKAKALNKTVPLVTSDVFVVCDSDTIVTSGSLERLIRPFSDQKVVVCGGVVVPRKKHTGFFWKTVWDKMQQLEYINSQVLRFGWQHHHSLLLVSGAFSAYRMDVLKKVGMFDYQSLVEDYEINYRMHHYCLKNNLDYAIRVCGDAVAYSTSIETLPKLIQQRTRWFQGFVYTLWKYRAMIGRSHYGRLGSVFLPIKFMDALMPFWLVVSYIVLVTDLYHKVLYVDGLELVLLRFVTVGFHVAILLLMCFRYLSPNRTQKERFSLFLFLPIYAVFQHLFYLAYSLNAFKRMCLNKKFW